MTSNTAATARKRPVNLTLSEEVVATAKQYSSNLSATVEILLTEYAARERQQAEQKRRQAQAAAHEWNAVYESVGSFADEHSTL